MSFTFALAFEIIAVLYIIFFLKELKSKEDKPTTESSGDNSQTQSHAADNMAYETTNLDELPVNKNVNFQLTPQLEPPKVDPPPVPQKRCLLRELFDLTLLMDCLRFPLVKRENNGRMLLILLILAYFLTAGPAAGEGEYFYTFTLKKLNWNGDKNGVFNAVNGGLALIGTFLGTAILSKMMKFSDSLIGMISALFIVISRFIYVCMITIKYTFFYGKYYTY